MPKNKKNKMKKAGNSKMPSSLRRLMQWQQAKLNEIQRNEAQISTQAAVTNKVMPTQKNETSDINKSLISTAALKQEMKSISTTNEGTIYLIPKPAVTKIPLLPTPNSNVITLVGRQNANYSAPVSQQKKILKFQMQMQAMQAEKKRLALQQNRVTHPSMHTSMEMPNTPVMEVMTSAPQPVQREIIETVFSMDQDDNSFSDDNSANLQQPLNPQQNELSISAVEFTHEQRKKQKYPAGIPRSFLQPQIDNGMPTHVWINNQHNASASNQANDPNIMNPLLIETNNQEEVAQPYSPSELYNDINTSQELNNDESKSSELNETGQKRLSAFHRLGPQKQPTKPKLTISVTVNDDQEVREVVDETEELEEITPVHLREDVILSTDETVRKYIKAWPWKRNVATRKTVTARRSKTVMILEREQMEEVYAKDTIFVQVTITGYPPSWTKEQVLDMLMESMRGYSFIPSFIEFNREQCKFLTLRCRSALLCLHKCGFIIRKDDVELLITLAQTDLTLKHIDFLPRLILRKMLNSCNKNDNKLELSEFTLKSDISHFIYFPLNRVFNQTELVQLQADTWVKLTDLNLSHNGISSLEGFELEQSTPKLKHLNLSHNCLERITALLSIRNLPLNSIHLEGNPLCTDYTDPGEYIKIIRMLFPTVTIIDDVAIQLKGDMPKFIRYYCPENAKSLVEKFLETYFPLLDGDIEYRTLLKEMYDDNAYMTITYHYKLGYGSIYRCYKSLFQSARSLEENNLTIIKGSEAIVNNIGSWPRTEHDPFSMNVDVMYHSDSTTILRVNGILKVSKASLPEGEDLLTFSRTLVLYTKDYVEYKIQSEMLYWGIPTNDCLKTAFTTIIPKAVIPKIDSTTDESLQKELLKIFMKLTTMDKNISERCLEFKKWNLKEALDHFSNLLELNSLDAFMKDL